ncbi:hypothetical protein TWF481_006259 [Arthrobotrys musiformis]|uniref:Aminoglycoside phosphotransferase domain-containing protein n=1 Tax=Arthrobotrys musiformis TaxID=47236 RepID=A0AAV9WG85_9PEZI
MATGTVPTSSDVMEWQAGPFTSRPVWRVEPKIDVVTDLMHSKIREILRDGGDNPQDLPKAAFLGGGAFNKLYLMEYRNSSWILRVTLPVDPHYKTASEVATLKLLESSTSLPAPRAMAHYAGAADAPPGDNRLGLEWILMTKVPGKTLTDSWDMSMKKKLNLVEMVAEKVHEIYTCDSLQFSSIGNVFECGGYENAPGMEKSPKPSKFSVDRIVSMTFFWNQRLSQPVNRGPFASSAEWFTSRLQLVDFECNQVLESEVADEDDKADAVRFKSVAQRLLNQIPQFVPANEKFVLHHDDINAGNLLVDPDTGDLTGIVDWECVSVLPAWKSCQLPCFLGYNPIRIAQPIRRAYHINQDGSPNELYFHHLREWELTVLGRRFLEWMEIQDSDWVDVYQASGRIRDFDYAVSNCDNEFAVKKIERWLNIVEKGDEGQYERLLQNINE